MTKILVFDGYEEVEVDRQQFTKDFAKELRDKGIKTTARDVDSQLKQIEKGEWVGITEVGRLVSNRRVPPYKNPGFWPFDNRLKPSWPIGYIEKDWDNPDDPVITPDDFEVPKNWVGPK